MAQALQKQVLSRLKRLPCNQENCRNLNQDNIEVIVFGKENTKKTGLMCSECLLDSELLNQLMPVERHTISLTKFMRTLTQKYREYADEKNALTWGPNMLEEQKREIKQLMIANQQALFKGIKQIVVFVQESQNSTLEQIKTLYKDKSFENISEMLKEQDEGEQQRMNIGKELKEITSNVLMVEGEVRLSNQSEIRQKHDSILFEYRKNIETAKDCLEKLIEVQRRCLKQLIK